VAEKEEVVTQGDAKEGEKEGLTANVGGKKKRAKLQFTQGVNLLATVSLPV